MLRTARSNEKAAEAQAKAYAKKIGNLEANVEELRFKKRTAENRIVELEARHKAVKAEVSAAKKEIAALASENKLLLAADTIEFRGRASDNQNCDNPRSKKS